jgi:hypothetical protein
VIDAITVTTETLWSLLNKRVRIESARYPDEPVEGILEWVGPDSIFGGFCAEVKLAPGHRHYVPVANIAYVAEVKA